MNSIGFQTNPQGNPNNCTDPYTPSFWLGKPGSLTQIRMPGAGWPRPTNDNFAVHTLLDGQAVDRSPYVCRSWTFGYEWLKPDVMTVFAEYATRQRGIGPFILIDPQMKNLLTPNQASGTDALHTSEGFSTASLVSTLSSSIASFVQGERALLWALGVPTVNTLSQYYDTFTRSVGNSWGSMDSGQAWNILTTGGPTAADYGVSGANNASFMRNTVTNQFHFAYIDAGQIDGDMIFDTRIQNASLTQPQSTWLVGRATDENNFYSVRYSVTVAGTLQYWLEKRVGGTFTAISSVITYGTYVPNTWIRGELRIIGSSLKVKIWYRDTEVQPTSWGIEITDSSITTGTIWGTGNRQETGNTNGTQFQDWDNFSLNVVTGDVLSLTPPTNLYGWCLPPGATYAFSGQVRGTVNTDSAVTMIPRVVQFNASGGSVGAVSGSVIGPVTGSWTSFCVTGSVPSGSVAPYLLPQFVVPNSSVSGSAGLLFDQLQLEITPTGQCTTWEYGQGQPFVGVRMDGETVPRILRTNMNFVAVEVT